MSGLTANGFERKRLIDILADIESAEKAIFGDNIDLNSESKFGQLNGIISEALSDAWETLDDLYNAFIPSSSTGVSLDNLVQLNGLTRQDGNNSTVTATLTAGTKNVTIPEGSLASVTGTEAQFITLDDLDLLAGQSGDVAMASVDEGPIEAAAGTLTKIETPIFSWESITNASDALLGTLEETDAELRQRREESVLFSSQNLADSLAAQLNNLDGVIEAVVVENKTNIVDANGLDPHTFAAVIVGGLANDIAEIIWTHTPQGIDSFGSLTEVITDGQGFSQDIKYNRPDEIDVYIKVDLTTDASYPGTGDDQVKQAIVAYGQTNFGISDDVVLSQLYTPINTIPGIIGIVLTMNKTGPPVIETSNVLIAFDEISSFNVTNIEIV